MVEGSFDDMLWVSPGLIPRPLLSVDPGTGGSNGSVVSPGLIPRPLLSVVNGKYPKWVVMRVAGVNPPAFVERWFTNMDQRKRNEGVAGVNPPAFVERNNYVALGCWAALCRRG